MKVVFIIGNGFDINLGLATQYENFYRFYLGLDSSNDSIQVKKLKEHLKNDQDQESRYQYWSDLEVGKVEMYIVKAREYSDNVEKEIVNLFVCNGFELIIHYVDFIEKTNRGKQRFLIQELK